METYVSLSCVNCRSTFSKSEDLFRCPNCSGLLDPQYNYDLIKKYFDWKKIRARPRSIWRWYELLPIEKVDSIVSLGEGDTPLMKCKSLGTRLGLENLFIKNDGLNPTGSLKDRSISVGVSKARELGYKTVACDSSGNKAASISAYASRAGLLCFVFCPISTPTQKLLQILAYGGQLLLVDTDRNGLMTLFSELRRRKKDWYDLGLHNPFRHEGSKTYAYEIVEVFDGDVPDWILHPAGGSMSLSKNWKGFKELKKMDLIEKMPKLVGVQPEICAPIVRAYKTESDIVTPVKSGPTIAGGLSISNPGEAGNLTLQAIRESEGKAISVSEVEILWGMQELGREGIFAEPSGAVTIPALRRMVQSGIVKKLDRVVCIVTGSGFKDLRAIERQVAIPKPFPAEISLLDEITEEYSRNSSGRDMR